MTTGGGEVSDLLPGEGSATTRSAGTILAVLCLAQLMLGIDITIVQVANPTIEKALGFTAEDLQWTITGYSLTFGGFLLLGGRIGDVFGRRRLFIVGMAGFAIASAGAGLSVGAGMLVAWRAAQGLCAAMVSPSVLALLAASFPEGRGRQRAYGLWASAISTGGIMGYVVGGALIAVIGWRGIFFINVPVCTVAVVLAYRLFRAVDRGERRPHIDLPGALTVTSGLALVIFGLGRAESQGWGATDTVASFVVAGVLLGAFAVVETHVAEPLLRFGLLKRREAVADLLSILQSTCIASSVFLNSLYLQQVFRYSPALAGLALAPLSAGVIGGSNISSRLMHVLGPRRIAPVGFCLIGVSLLWLSRVPDHGSYAATYLPALLGAGLGLGLGMVALVNTATSGVAPSEQGIVGGLYNMSIQLGGAIGLATLVTIAAAGAASAHLGPIASEAVGIRLGYRVLVVVAATGVLIAAIGLPTRARTSSPAVSSADLDALVEAVDAAG